MNENEFFKILETELSYLSESVRRVILKEYKEKFSEEVKKGLTQEEAIKAIGHPKIIAKKIKFNQKVESVQKRVDKAQGNDRVWSSFKESLKVTALLFGFVPLNIIILLIPLFVILPFMFGWFTINFGLLFPFALLAFSPFTVFLFDCGWLEFLAVFFIVLGLIGFLITSILANYYSFNWFVSKILQYLKWNLRFLKKELK